MAVTLGTNIALPISSAYSCCPPFDKMGVISNYGNLGVVADPDSVIEALFANSEEGAWYDPSDFSTMFQDSAGTTPVTAVGQTVGKILDKSGNGNHAYQATSASRPALQQDGNGKYYLDFDGVDDFLATAAINLTSTDKVYVMSGVYRTVSLSGMIAAFGNYVAAAGTFALYNNSVDVVAGINGTAAGGRASGATPYLPYANQVCGAQFDIAESLIEDEAKIYMNGSEQPTTVYFGGPAGTGNFSTQILTVGKFPDDTIKFAGRIYQLIICGKLLSDADKAATSDYVNASMGGVSYTALSGCASIGDSTAVPVLPLLSTSRTKYTIAAVGATSAYQKEAYSTFDYKGNLAWVVIMVGINDLATLTAAQLIASIQSLVDTVNRYSPSETKVFIAKMPPCRQALIDTYGETEGEAQYQEWLTVNEAIAGVGATPITNVAGRVTSHEAELNDGNGNLKSIYDDGTHLHPNDAGDQVIADAWFAAITSSGMTP